MGQIKDTKVPWGVNLLNKLKSVSQVAKPRTSEHVTPLGKRSGNVGSTHTNRKIKILQNINQYF
jgi:hypothetical protein